jgi:hypothetical protein
MPRVDQAASRRSLRAIVADIPVARLALVAVSFRRAPPEGRASDESHAHLPEFCGGIGARLEGKAVLEHRRGLPAQRAHVLHHPE